MVTENVPSPTDSSPDASVVTDGAKSGKGFTGEEAWLLFAKVQIEKKIEKLKTLHVSYNLYSVEREPALQKDRGFEPSCQRPSNRKFISF